MEQLIVLAAAPAAATELSVWGLIVKGGWLMIPIFILSVIAVYSFCERYLLIRRYTKRNDAFIENIQACLRKGDSRAALDLCREENTPVARMIAKGVRHRNLPVAELHAIMDSTANLEVAAMEKGLNPLATCAGMAPMIGFLGTVVGMVQAFYDMSVAGSNINITLLSRGIYTAMVTTVAGLIVGIIAYFAYNILTGYIDRVVNLMESASADFMEAIYEINSQK